MKFVEKQKKCAYHVCWMANNWQTLLFPRKWLSEMNKILYFSDCLRCNGEGVFWYFNNPRHNGRLPGRAEIWQTKLACQWTDQCTYCQESQIYGSRYIAVNIYINSFFTAQIWRVKKYDQKSQYYCIFVLIAVWPF